MPAFRDLVGSKFGRLSVVERVNSVTECGLRPRTTYRCLCECGRRTTVTSNRLTAGVTRSCGCLREEAVRVNVIKAVNSNKGRPSKRRLPPGIAAMRALRWEYGNGARKRGLDFCLTDIEFSRITSSNCYICGVPPRQVKHAAYASPYTYNGVDRIDSSLGYTVENCAPCCRHCNVAKGAWSLDEFKRWLMRAHENYIKQNARSMDQIDPSGDFEVSYIGKPSQRSAALIQRFEGLRLSPYKDLAGLTTYGYGHKTTEWVSPEHITQEEAEELLKSDLEACAATVNHSVYVKLSQNQFDALCSLIFNIGPGNFIKSTLRKRLNTSDYRGAADQFLVWDKVKQTVIHGLVNRRMVERDLFLEGMV